MWNNIYTREVQHDRFPMYKSIVGDTENKVVMDFGGNSGNLLHFSEGQIKEENFVCVDTALNALEFGKAEYPNAEWVHYNRYGWCYNQSGEKDGPFPEISKKIDHIFSYSVLSHTDFNEILETLKWMKSLNPETIAVSVLLTENKLIADWFWRSRVQEYGSCIDFRDELRDCKTTFSLFDNNLIISDTPRLTELDSLNLITFYHRDWLISELAKEGLDVELVQPPFCYQTFLVLK
jgi:hypothetical protein